jgi:hypothetical protein
MKYDFTTDKSARPAVAVFDNYWATTLTFAISLGRRGVPLHFYGKGAGRWSRYCSAHRDCPPITDAGQFVPWLRDQIRSGAIARVAPTTDLIAYYISYLREEFSPQVQRSILPLSELETCLIKTRFSSACARVNGRTPDTIAPDDDRSALELCGALGYPLILKPKSHLVVGTGERGRLIHNAAELQKHYRPYRVADGQESLAHRYPELRWPLLQRYISSARQRVYSVTGFKDVDTGIVAASLSFKCEQWPRDVGTSTVQVSCHDELILRAGLEIVNSVVSRGIFELELLTEGESLLAIDLNPRAFGFIALNVALGHDLPWLWLRSTLSPVEPGISTVTPPMSLEARHKLLHMIRMLVGWSLSGAQAQPRRHTGAAPVSMVGQLSDPVPMLISNLALLRHPRSLIRTQYQAARAAIVEQDVEQDLTGSVRATDIGG